MNLTVNNNPTAYTGYRYVVRCNENKKVPYIYNKIHDILQGRGVPAVFDMGHNDDKVIFTPATKTLAHSLKRELKHSGIKLSRNEYIA